MNRRLRLPRGEVARGVVSLVGAGPGDPELLTIRAVRRLRDADLVLYDALVPAELLKLAPHARCLLVGKRAGRPGERQSTINNLMRRMALRGQRVVRLKCGDPFVLGRGGEEALALAAAGIRVEIVPGVSTAIAAPALAGIPVTHRGMASGFAVLSGHDERAFRPVLEAMRPGSLTLVVLMGLATRASLAQVLIDRGWPLHTPAAVLFAASTSRAVTWTATLSELPAAPVDECPGAPGTIVIGDVVEVRTLLGRSDHDAKNTDSVGDGDSDDVRLQSRRTAVRRQAAGSR